MVSHFVLLEEHLSISTTTNNAHTMFLPRRSLSCYCAFLGIMTVKALSTWSETAIKAARELTIVQKEKLLAEEGVFRKRLVTITAERLETTTSTNTESDSNVVTKIIHFQRHGQGKYKYVDVDQGTSLALRCKIPNEDCSFLLSAIAVTVFFSRLSQLAGRYVA